MQNISRRQFVHSISGATLGLAAFSGGASTVRAMQPLRRTGEARLHLSLAAYSFRQYFGDGRGGKKDSPDGGPISLFDFIDYCAEQDCVGAELTSYYFPADLEPDYLLRIRRHAFLRGIEISGTAVGNTFTHPPGEQRDREIAHVKQWVDHAAVMGAPHIRIFAGNEPRDVDADRARTLCIEAIEECCEYAGSKGVFLGLENHGGIVAEPDELLAIVRAVKSPWFGVNLDTGNFRTDDPYAGLEACAPFAINVQVKVEMRPRNQPAGPADLPRLIEILRRANYQGYVTLEYEAATDPWTEVPRYLDQLSALM